MNLIIIPEKETETNPQAPPNPHEFEGLLPLVDMISRQEVLSKGKEKGSWSGSGDGSFSLLELLPRWKKPTWGARVVTGLEVSCPTEVGTPTKWAFTSRPFHNGATILSNPKALVNAHPLERASY